jgi:hypothetical protein
MLPPVTFYDYGAMHKRPLRCSLVNLALVFN